MKHTTNLFRFRAEHVFKLQNVQQECAFLLNYFLFTNLSFTNSTSDTIKHFISDLWFLLGLFRLLFNTCFQDLHKCLFCLQCEKAASRISFFDWAFNSTEDCTCFCVSTRSTQNSEYSCQVVSRHRNGSFQFRRPAAIIVGETSFKGA